MSNGYIRLAIDRINSRPYIRIGGVDHGIDNEDLSALYKELQLFFCEKIKLHTMSEEPFSQNRKAGQSYRFFIILDSWLPMPATLFVFDSYCFFQADGYGQFSWDDICEVSPVGWLYYDEIKILTKNNTAP